MVLFPILIFICYFALVAILIIGWNRLVRKSAVSAVTNRFFVSVIIPTRNESSNISHLLGDLEYQSYTDYEVIVVDDHSEDDSKEIVKGFVKKNTRFRTVSSSREGKKTALTLGIRSAKGSIIITTDADCRVTSEWLSSLVGCFHNDNVKMVIAPVKMEGNSLFSDFQSLEFASLIGSGMAMASWKFPVMCNGANLAFRKSVFEEVDGYQGNFHIPSGDDEFLMRKVLNAYPAGINVSSSKQSVVTTLPNRTFSEFCQQRIRWAGKWSANHSFVSRLLGLFVFCFQLTIVLIPLFLAIKWIDAGTCLALLLVKAALELLFLKKVTLGLGIRWSWISFVILQIIYPAYVVVIGVLSRFTSFVWKGRKLKSLTVSEKLNEEISG